MPFRLSLIALLLAAPLSAAPPSVTHLFPAGGQRGTTVEVTVAGSFERWPVRVWCSGRGVTATAAAKGKLAVTLAADAEPGTCWLRLHDEQGASAPRPFIVGRLPEVHEKEPNDEIARAQVVAPGTTVSGKLEKAGDVDCFAVALKKGQTLLVAVEAQHTLRAPLDAAVQIVSPAGFVLDQNNDAIGLDPRLAFQAPDDGIYIVRLFAFPATPDSSIRFFGSEASVYRLTLATEALTDDAAIKRVATPGAVESVSLPALKGKPLVLRAEVKALGSALMPVLRVLDASGKQLARADAANAHTDVELTFAPPQDGAYRVQIGDTGGDGGPWHRFRLHIMPAEPDFDLTIAADQFSVVPGKPLDVPVAVLRRHGFAGEVELSAVGLPPGVTAVPTGKGDGKTLTLRLTAEKGGVLGPFQIIGRMKGRPEMNRPARAALAGFDATTADLWLTTTAPVKK